MQPAIQRPTQSHALHASSRVQVFSADGRYVYSVHREEALRMVREGQAERRGSGRMMRAVTLTQSLIGQQRGPCSPTSLRNLMGQAYTYREALTGPVRCQCGGDKGCPLCGGTGTVEETTSHCTSFKPIDPRDRKVFVASLLDCLTPDLREELLRQLGQAGQPGGGRN